MENPQNTGDNANNNNANTDISKLTETVEKQGGMLSKLYNKFFDKDVQTPPPVDPKPANSDDLHAQLLDAKKKELEYENRIKEFELQDEQRKLAQESLDKKVLSEKIDKDINELITNKVIAADDKEEIADWKEQFNSNYDSAKKRAEKRIKSATVDVPKDKNTSDKSTATEKELRRERLATRIFSSLNI
jgi:hypothetical protein